MENTVSEPGKIDGRKMRLGTETYIVPPLSLRGLKTHEKLIDKVQTDQSMTSGDKVDAIATVALCALNRNYPHMNLETLLDVVDVGNLQELFEAVMAQSGLVKAPAGEARATEASTGQPSSVASPQGSE